MKRIAFKMKLIKGNEKEYETRHNKLWPEMQTTLKEAGISNYSIFLDIETSTLFAYLTIHNETNLQQLPNKLIVKKWWLYMKDIMETNPDNSPIQIPLNEVFYLQ